LGNKLIGSVGLSIAGGTPSPYTRTTSFVIACSDETTAIDSTGTKCTFFMPYGYTIESVRASLTTTSSSGTPTIDISEDGTSIMTTTKITIDVDVTGTDATGLKVYIIGYKTL